MWRLSSQLPWSPMNVCKHGPGPAGLIIAAVLQLAPGNLDSVPPLQWSLVWSSGVLSWPRSPKAWCLLGKSSSSELCLGSLFWALVPFARGDEHSLGRRITALLLHLFAPLSCSTVSLTTAVSFKKKKTNVSLLVCVCGDQVPCV